MDSKSPGMLSASFGMGFPVPGVLAIHSRAVTFERELYDAEYYRTLHPHHWFKNPKRKYEERNRDVLAIVCPRSSETVVELGSARGDISFFLSGYAREVIGVDAAPEALEMAESERKRLKLENVRWLEADVANLAAIPDRSVDAVAAIDLVEHIDDPTLMAMLGECRRILKTRGRLGIYTPDRAHYVERMKARNFLIKQFPQHIGVRFTSEYQRLLQASGFHIELSDYSVSPFPLVRWLEKALAWMPLLGPLFRYRILIRAVPIHPDPDGTFSFPVSPNAPGKR